MKLTTSAPATRTAALAADTVLSPVLSGRKGAHGGTSVHASLFLVVALATTPRPVPEGCARGGPLVAVASMPGLGPGPLGVIVAVWANGRILRARDPMDPARGYVEDRLTPTGLEQVLAVEQSGYWKWKQPDLALDLPEQLTVVCVGTQRVRRIQTVGFPASSPATRIKQ